MPDLLHSLQSHDLGFLRIIARLWGLELAAQETEAACQELAACLLDPRTFAELIEALPLEARTALAALAASTGRVSWSAFTRRYGEIREMGAARRDREHPYLKPASAVEVLFYRGLLARAFFDARNGPQEFAYVPDDLLELTRRGIAGGLAANPGQPLGREATPAERAHLVPADDHLLDDATTLLAALRLGHDIAPDPILPEILRTAGLVKKSAPQAKAVKGFLELPRGEAVKMLVNAWKQSEVFDELRLIPGLVCEGEWTNSSLETRRMLLAFLRRIPPGKWWSLAAFIGDVKQKQPDFQRPGGDYDSWFIRRTADGQYLRSFAAWDEVDGALIRFFISTVMYALGLVDLARANPGGDFTAFRIHLLDAMIPAAENGKFHIAAQGRVAASRWAPRAARYQLARFCEWEDDGRVVPKGRIETRPDEYRYRITPRSLTRAAGQGLKVEHLLALLANHSEAGLPPVLVRSLKRWEAHGAEARAETQVVLRVSRPEILKELRKSKAARFLGEPLGPTAVIIKAGAQSKVLAALAELGLLAEDSTTDEM